MKRIILLSLVIPTFNNTRAASALPYHLIRGMGNDATFEIFSFNINKIDEGDILKVEQELNVKIHVLQQPKWMAWMFKFHLSFLRLFLNFPYLAYCNLTKETINKINSLHPDVIWIYGEEISGLAKKFKNQSVVVTMPDCTSLYYYRLLGKSFATIRIIDVVRYLIVYLKYLRLERYSYLTAKANHVHVKYHFVGQVDTDFFKEHVGNANAVFLRHPLYAHQAKDFTFHMPIRLLIAGQYNIYMKKDADILIAELEKNSEELKRDYVITFLGKGWEPLVEKLQTLGYKVEQIRFAPVYIDELQRHDIQITPISVGTGTKGKVLDAVSNGLLTIGTEAALENIALKDGESCIIYKDVDMLISLLKDIPSNIHKYEAMAEIGYKEIIVNHDHEKVAHDLFKS